MKILFIDTVHPFLENSLVQAGHICVDGSSMSREELMHIIPGYDGIVIRSRIRIDKNFLESARGLKFVARAGAGMENIDIDAANKRGIICLNAPEGNRDAVAEQAIGMLLSLFTQLNKADKEVREGKWNRESNRGHELMGKTVAVIGYGNTGSSLAKKLSGFGCRILAYDKYLKNFSSDYVTEAGMDEIFLKADVLSLHIPLTSETEYLVNIDFLNKFEKNIWLINTARGKCVRTDDLVSKLKDGKVLGACLDVLEYEDLTFEKFDIQNTPLRNSGSWDYLINSKRVILTPHIAGWTFESHEKISKVLFDKINALKH